MKIIIAILFLSMNLAAAEQNFIKSKDEIQFHSPENFKFSSVGKIPEFRGVISRVFPQSNDLQMLDLYQFKTDDVKVSEKLCLDFVEKIFGLSKSKLFSMKTLTVEKSNKGNVCEVFITDTNKVKEDPFLRYVTVGFINAKANVLVYHPSSISDAKISEIRKFWEILR